MDKVFERFYKADEARSISSSGLGLSIAKELVERMGGELLKQGLRGSGLLWKYSLSVNKVLKQLLQD
mgnify:CR=1 FL=1